MGPKGFGEQGRDVSIRRIELKRTSKVLTLGLFALFAAAAVVPLALAQGQRDQPQVPETRQQLDSLVSQARAALTAGELDQAERLISVAEQSQVRYPTLHFGDTAKKVRHDWLKATKQSASNERPSFNPLAAFKAKPEPPKSDPFLAANATQAAAGTSTKQSTDDRVSPATLNIVSTEQPAVGPAQASGEAREPMAVSSRETSDRALLTARRALSVGDLPRAEQFLARAREQQVAYQADEDSPERVKASIDECRRIAQIRKADPQGDSWRHAYAKYLVVQSEALTHWGDLETAERTATEAGQLSSQFATNEVAPQDVLQQIAMLRQSAQQQAAAPEPVTQPPSQVAAAGTAAAGTMVQDNQVTPASSGLPQQEGSAVQLAQGSFPQGGSGPYDNEVLPLPKPAPVDAAQLLEQGEELLRNGQRAAALDSFKAAYEDKDALDLISQQRLQGHLQMLSVEPAESRELPAPRSADGGLLGSIDEERSVLARQIWSDVSKKQAEATRIRELDPVRSRELLLEATKLVENSGLDERNQGRLLSSVNKNLASVEKYIKDHQAEIDLEAANRAVLDENDRRSRMKVEVGERIAELVDQFNKLSDEHRYAEAEVVANKLYEMAPEQLVAQQVWRQAKTRRREDLNREIIDKSEEGFAGTMLDIRGVSADAMVNATRDYAHGANWKEIAKRKGSSDLQSRRNARELEIEQKLKTDVSVSYNETPLVSVVEGLSDLAGVNIHLDPLGLSQQAVRSDTPITIDLKSQVSLKSALQLILEPLGLTYTIKDEVLKITSEEIRDGDVYTDTYNVADLVIPIPNFVPSTNMGLQGLINDAYAATAMTGTLGTPGPMAGLVDNGGVAPAGGALGRNQLGQANFGGPGTAGSVSSPGGGPPLGGAANADFDSLIDLIVSTVEHDSWMENGTGEGEIQPFPTNLSLVISQTQRVHEQIRDLLEQLRRQQDLQVTIEVRFIRLTDSFFERIGIDFDFNIEDNIPFTPQIEADGSYAPNQPSSVVGVTGALEGNTGPLFNVALDSQFRQGSFTLSQPQFGTPSDFATFGFSILSDIEAYFFITAAQGDRRANTLNAPKVTLFNGQQAIVVDTAFVPFVISVIPVVGEFAAAQQPVIVVLSEGTMMTVQAVVSDDRRYVRLTLVPFFSQIGEVRTFTFDGAETTTNTSNTTDGDDDGNNEADDNSQQTIRSGTTVQLPTFQVIAVATTVSVPDGGTVLLGGIKRLREGRNEFGVPLLSKVPYLDRLFRNVGIGRETDSLMMMVTPHIIIQEEEEERLGISF